MDISTLCKDYFNGFKEISTPRSSPGTKILAALKILSYITLIVPLGFAIASLFGRISSNPPGGSSSITKATQNLFLKSSDNVFKDVKLEDYPIGTASAIDPSEPRKPGEESPSSVPEGSLSTAKSSLDPFLLLYNPVSIPWRAALSYRIRLMDVDDLEDLFPANKDTESLPAIGFSELPQYNNVAFVCTTNKNQDCYIIKKVPILTEYSAISEIPKNNIALINPSAFKKLCEEKKFNWTHVQDSFDKHSQFSYEQEGFSYLFSEIKHFIGNDEDQTKIIDGYLIQRFSNSDE